jgi:hypothetical protein
MTLRSCRWIVLAAAGMLALAPSAAAKGPATLEICGADTCRTFKADPERGSRNLELVFSALNVGFDSTEYVPAPAPAPFYTLEVSAEGLDEGEPRTYVPSVGVTSVQMSWVRLNPSLARRYARATAGLAPAPAPAIHAARVGGVRVDDAGPYARLLGELSPAAPPADPQPHVNIILGPDRVTPWADPARALRFFPKDDLLHRGGGDWVRVPPELAAVIERDGGLQGTDTGGPPVAPLAAAGALALALLVAAGLLFARRRAGRRAPAGLAR